MPVDPEIYHSLGANERPFKTRKHGLGIRNAIKRKTNVTPESDAFGQMFFKTIIAAAPLTKFPPANWLIKKVAMLGGTHNTRGHSIPMYLDSATTLKGGSPAFVTLERLDAAVSAAPGKAERQHRSKTIEMNKMVASNIEHVHPPVDLLIDVIDRATYRATLDECLCRKIQGCKDYPIDLGCLFLGPAAKDSVRRGVAHEVTRDEAIAHVKRAVEAGLSPSAYFVEVEEYVWGWPDEELPNVLEVCFCCPCCCSAVRFEAGAAGELERILHQGIGWSCVADDTRCVGCGACEAACPHDCAHVLDDRVQIHETCAGCGQCVRVCGCGALSVRQTGETKPRIDDYFEKLNWKL